jgi:hypothetical protein
MVLILGHHDTSSMGGSAWTPYTESLLPAISVMNEDMRKQLAGAHSIWSSGIDLLSQNTWKMSKPNP